MSERSTEIRNELDKLDGDIDSLKARIHHYYVFIDDDIEEIEGLLSRIWDLLEERGYNMSETKEKKPSMYLRRGVEGGAYFLSPKKTVIYRLNGKHLKEFVEKKRDSVLIRKGTLKEEIHNQ